ncbi:MAG: DUF1311 domain-containing protein [Proteobacteria bacterium]|nr:DUF1311 domain-containing protein [Pseudomonadota bacterium]
MKALLPAILSCTMVWCSPPALASDADMALNQHYRALMEQLDEGNQARLRDAQRAWLAFRDKECAFKAQGQRDGARARSVQASCIEELTALRAEQLQRELDCDVRRSACVARKSVSAAASPAPASAQRSCAEEAGAVKAERYVAQCLQVSPATHPPCNAANACALIADEIKRGCGLLGKDAPKFCTDYR